MIQPIFFYGFLMGVNVTGDETIKEILEECQRILFDIGILTPKFYATAYATTTRDFETYLEFVEMYNGFPQCYGVWVCYCCESYPDKCVTSYQSQQDNCPDCRKICNTGILYIAHECLFKGIYSDNAFSKFIEWVGNNCHFGQ